MSRSVRFYPGMMLNAMAGLSAKEGHLLLVVTLLNFQDAAAISKADRRLRFFTRMTSPRLQKAFEALRGYLGETEDGDVYSLIADRMADLQKTARPAIPAALKKAVFDRDGMICVYCDDVEGPFELDHRIPWSRGGDHSLENLCVACRDCNRAKYNMTEGEFING